MRQKFQIFEVGPSNPEIFHLSLFYAFLVNSRLGRTQKHDKTYLSS